jgi:predicted nucleotidyltransferase
MMTEQQDLFEPHLILPVGTQIVTRVPIKGSSGQTIHQKGSVGVIIDVRPDLAQQYMIRFPSGGEFLMARQDFAVRKHLRQATLQQQLQHLGFADLYPQVIYRCVVGSRAYGLDNDESDTDRRGFYLSPADLQWSLNGAPEQIENEHTQETYWELQKFLLMALRANPNVLECLFTPLIEYKTPLVDELLAMRSGFLSRFVYQTYNGYVLSQFKKLEADLRLKGEPRWKHAMHLIRLLLSGITVLREGSVLVRVEDHRDQLLAIKRTEMPWKEVNAWRLSLHREFDNAFNETTLPDHPDFERANAYLIKARRSVL